MRIRIETPTPIIVKIVKPVSLSTIGTTAGLFPSDITDLPTEFVGVKVLFSAYSVPNYSSVDDYEVFYRAYGATGNEIVLSSVLKETDGITFTSPINNTRVGWGVFSV